MDEPLPVREYKPPDQHSINWRLLLRPVILGPMTGGAVGFTSTSASLFCWLIYGQPDFYFRGWNGVVVHYFLLTAGGLIIGVFYGTALFAVEVVSRRRVNLAVMIPVLLALTFAVRGIWTANEFQTRQLTDALLPEMGTAAAGFVLSIVTARRIQA